MPTTKYPIGEKTVETCTMTSNREDAWIGIVVGRLRDGSRTLAVTAPGDEESPRFLTGEPFGGTFAISTDGRRNTAAAFKQA